MTCTDYFSIVFDNGIGVDEISRLCSNVHIVFIFETYTGSLSIFVLLISGVTVVMPILKLGPYQALLTS